MIGVDIDGVLGNQVDGVLDRVNASRGSSFKYEDIKHWDMPLGNTSFKPAIDEAMDDCDYVLGMPVHEGAQQMLDALREHYYVRIITVRKAEVMPLTEQWLLKNTLSYDELVPALETLKSRHGAEALIDDYAGNLSDFLCNTEGVGMLVDQPWNQDVPELRQWLGGPRLIRVFGLADIPSELTRMLR